MKSKLTFLILAIFLAFSSYAQKQLDSTYAYQFKNNRWEPTQRKVYTYPPNSEVEVFSGFDASLNGFKLISKSIDKYDPKCSNNIQEIEYHSVEVGTTTLKKTNTTIFERDNQCRLYRQSLIRATQNDTSIRYIYSDFDQNGRAKREKLYKLSGTKLALDYERKHDIAYYADKKLKTYTTYNVVNGSNVPHNKTEYVYTGEKIKSITLLNYEQSSGNWKKYQEFKYDYIPKFEVFTLTVFTGPDPKIISIDSSFLDNDNDKILTLSYYPIGPGFASSFKTEYFYSKKSSSVDQQIDPKLDVQFSNISQDKFGIEIINPSSKKLQIFIYDLLGRRLFQKSYDGIEIINDELPNFYGLKVITVYDQNRIGYSRLIGF